MRNSPRVNAQSSEGLESFVATGFSREAPSHHAQKSSRLKALPTEPREPFVATGFSREVSPQDAQKLAPEGAFYSVPVTLHRR